jgi:hypothetical protein
LAFAPASLPSGASVPENDAEGDGLELAEFIVGVGTSEVPE